MNKKENGIISSVNKKVEGINDKVIEMHTDIKWIKRELEDLDEIRRWQECHEEEHRQLIWKIIAPFVFIAGAIGGFLGKLFG
jgi:hypothetical protein